MLKPIGLVSGHYECRSLEGTVPVLQEFLALEVVRENGKEVVMKHPNTGWLLVVHEGGPAVQDKNRLHHYGVRVATNQEVDNAHEYLRAKKQQFRLKVDKTQNRHLAHSVHFVEPGGNWWEIESYEKAARAGFGENVAVPWEKPLSADRFPGRGYVPQALTHGTITCINIEASRRFYQEVLGLDVVSPSHTVKPHYIKHPSTPWYIVSLEREPRPSAVVHQRFAVAVESATAVEEAHRWMKESGKELGVTELEEIQERSGGVSFLLSDLDANWWEISSPLN